MGYCRPEIEAMAGYEPGEQLSGGDYIKLNTNENPYPASPRVAEAVQTVLERRPGNPYGPPLERYPNATAEPFRRKAAEVLSVPADWILCGNGSDELLTILTRTMVGAGQLLRLPYPSYILYKTLAEIQGGRSEEIRFRPDWSLGDDFCRPRDDLRLVFLPNPNSPSGTVIAPRRILEIAEQLPCPLIVDEAYADFAETNCLDLVSRCEKIIVMRTLSKSYALAGLRFGYLVARPHIIEQLNKVKDSYNCDTLSIAAATAAIGDRQWQVENRAKILATRAKLIAGMRTLGFTVLNSQANFAWCVHAEQPVKPLFEELRRRKILVRYMNYPLWSDGLRISVGTEEQIDACLDLLRTLM